MDDTQNFKTPLYFGGGNWGVPDANRHVFYTASAYDETNNSGLLRLSIEGDGTTKPGYDNSTDLGSSSQRWRQFFCANGTINTSDSRDKSEIKSSDLGLSFINLLKPSSYKWTVGCNVPTIDAGKEIEGPGEDNVTLMPRPGKRTHYGLIAQQVKDALEEVGCTDFAGWTLDDKNDPDSRHGLPLY